MNYGKDGTYTAIAKGQLTIHGVTKPLEAPVTLSVQNGKINVATAFTVSLSDYQISIPSIVKDKVSKSVKVTIDAMLDPLN